MVHPTYQKQATLQYLKGAAPGRNPASNFMPVIEVAPRKIEYIWLADAQRLGGQQIALHKRNHTNAAP